MSEKGKEILTKLTEGMEKANDLQREFLFGYAEAIIATHKQNEEKEVEAETKQQVSFFIRKKEVHNVRFIVHSAGSRRDS